MPFGNYILSGGSHVGVVSGRGSCFKMIIVEESNLTADQIPQVVEKRKGIRLILKNWGKTNIMFINAGINWNGILRTTLHICKAYLARNGAFCKMR